MPHAIASTESLLVLPASCDADMAPGLLADLRAAADGASAAQPLSLDLTPGPPTAFALQLLVAAATSLGRASAFSGYGPMAAAALDPEKS